MSSITCIHCGAALNRPGAKFCTSCGKSQVAAEPVAVAVSAHPPIEATPAPPTAPAGMQSAFPSAESRQMEGQPTLVIQDEGQVREVPLGKTPLTIGRAPSKDVPRRETGLARRDGWDESARGPYSSPSR